MRPIDADELKDKLIRLAQDDDLKFWAPVIGACVKEIDDAPTVDAVQVVRCEDCVHKDVPCPLYGGSQFFCAYGERRSE